MANPAELNDIEEVVLKLQQEQAVLLYFYSDSCAPCISLRPKVIDLVRQEFPMMGLFLINSEKHPEIAAAHNCFSNPTIVLYFEGKEFRRMSKYISIPQLSDEIMRPYALLFED